MKKPPVDPDQRSPQEAARLRDESIRRMIATPPKKLKDEPKKPRVSEPKLKLKKIIPWQR
ncbi:MAG: hypothetical protein Q8R82_05835 [Hyphomonadaceae bacterium]|nr:hypothetical protein [Hyphomonadaceae bacterium]